MRGVQLPSKLSAAELMELDLGEVRWAVPGILPEGVTILAGKPKLGKSWMALGLCIAVASGGDALGKVPVDPGDVLYMALEDNHRRLQKRLKKLLVGAPVPEGLDVWTQTPKLGEGLEAELEDWLEFCPNPRLIVIDTLKKIRPRAAGNRNAYDVDYESVESLLPIAAEHSVSVMLVHHLRKAAADDPIDEINSSTGLTGGVDGVLILKRDRGKADASLMVDGRDVEKQRALALKWDQQHATWVLEGDAADFQRSDERQRILEVVRAAVGPIGPKEVAQAIKASGKDASYGSIRVMMRQMVHEGLLDSPSYGKYTAPEKAIDSVNTNIRQTLAVNNDDITPKGVNAVKTPLRVVRDQESRANSEDSPNVNGVNARAEASHDRLTSPGEAGRKDQEAINTSGSSANTRERGINNRRLTAEEAMEVQQPISEGLSASRARTKVLNKKEEA